MHIKISIKSENADAILGEGMECINRAAGDAPQWEKNELYHYYETECKVTENDIVPVFNGLIAKYPALDLYAVYTEDIREDDRSAQWWRTTTVTTEHHPEGSKLSFESSTYWF